MLTIWEKNTSVKRSNSIICIARSRFIHGCDWEAAKNTGSNLFFYALRVNFIFSGLADATSLSGSNVHNFNENRLGNHFLVTFKSIAFRFLILFRNSNIYIIHIRRTKYNCDLYRKSGLETPWECRLHAFFHIEFGFSCAVSIGRYFTSRYLLLFTIIREIACINWPEHRSCFFFFALFWTAKLYCAIRQTTKTDFTNFKIQFGRYVWIFLFKSSSIYIRSSSSQTTLIKNKRNDVRKDEKKPKFVASATTLLFFSFVFLVFYRCISNSDFIFFFAYSKVFLPAVSQ